MQTKAQAVSEIKASVEAICDIDLIDTRRLEALVSHYYDMTASITGYSVLPDALLPFVRTACVRAWRRRGSEANVRFSGIGVSESYIDIEDDLRKQVRKMKNPLSPVIVAEEVTEASNA